MATNTGIIDASWMRQSFMLPVRAIDTEDASRRIYSTSKWKYVDTTLGGNMALNPLPQFTRWADLRVRNLFNIGYGLGRYYSEIIDDNQQRVHLRFGVPEYNSLTGFFSTFYDPQLSQLVRKGRSKGYFYGAGYLIGTVLSAPVQLMGAGAGIMRYWLGAPANKFAYLKPTMALYWNALQTMLNTVGANMGIAMSPPQDRYSNWGNAGNTVMDVKSIPNEQLEIIRKMLPQSWSSAGGINVYAVSKRAQMYADAYYRAMKEALDKAKSHDELRAYYRAVEAGTTTIDLTEYSTSSRTLQEFISQYMNTNLGQEGKEQGDGTANGTPTMTADGAAPAADASGAKVGEAKTPSEAPEQAAAWRGGQSVKEVDPTADTGVTNVWNHVLAEAREGASWVSLRVDHIGTVSESISTSVSESALASSINSMSSSKRKFQFNTAGGNLGDGVIASTIEGIVGGVTDFIAGGADAIGIGGMGVLLGNGLVDLPKDWESTIVNLPKADFTIELRTVYGDKIARYQNLMVPLCALLVGALPRSTGPSSFDRPFMCEMFYGGRQQVRYGVIDSLSITRGTGNVGWTQRGEPLGIDVSFSVIDLSSMMHMPIAQGLMDNGMSIARYFFGDDTTYSDYLATLASVTLADRTYGFETLGRRWKNAKLDWDNFWSVGHFVSEAFNTLPGRAIQAIAHQSNRN